jgi:4-amino-4-deoxy-L-arabinose transferase-like glycosyltransferase
VIRRPASPAIWILVALVVVGVALRVVVAASWWPASLNLADSWPYSTHAWFDILGNPQHPAGYSLLLAFLGLFTKSLPVFIVLQQLAGIASALLLFGAVRRLTGSPWPALVPAAVVLLGADQLYLEHTIMSEGPFLLFLSGSLYAAVRALDDLPALGWVAAAAALLAAACVIRSAGMFMLPILVLVLLFARPGARSWRPALVTAGVGASILIGYASIKLIANDRFEVGPSTGWHLYARTAQFADCGQFDPPTGTARLCERSSPSERRGRDYYMFDTTSPGYRQFGFLGKNDDKLGAFGRAVILNQPKTYAETVWRDLRAYWAPATRPPMQDTGGDLSPQLDFTYVGEPSLLRRVEKGMEGFFDPFEVDRDDGGIAFLDGYQKVFRFGATLLSICTLLIALGLLVGERRSRLGALLFGVGGIVILIPPVLLVYYVGRYTVPSAGPISAGAAIAAYALWSLESARRRGEREAAPPTA